MTKFIVENTFEVQEQLEYTITGKAASSTTCRNHHDPGV